MLERMSPVRRYTVAGLLTTLALSLALVGEEAWGPLPRTRSSSAQSCSVRGLAVSDQGLCRLFLGHLPPITSSSNRLIPYSRCIAHRSALGIYCHFRSDQLP
jgi:hypothetical protein